MSEASNALARIIACMRAGERVDLGALLPLIQQATSDLNALPRGPERDALERTMEALREALRDMGAALSAELQDVADELYRLSGAGKAHAAYRKREES